MPKLRADSPAAAQAHRGGREAALLTALAFAPIAAAGRLGSWTGELGALQALAFVSFAALAAILARSPRWRLPHGVALVTVVALALRLCVIARPPELSDDLFRYVWDGRVLAAGVDPYAFAPADTALAALRDSAVHARINHPHLRTIYPPLAEAGFAFAHFALPGVTGMKVWVLLHDVALCALLALWCLRRGGSALPAVAYAWNPLVVIEYAGSGHHDPTALLPLALAFYLAEKRPALSALAFAAAVLGKLLPLVALPMLWRAWPWRARAVAAAVTGAGLALFAWRALGRSSGLQAYAATWRNNELAFHYAALWMGEPAARLAAAVVVALVALAAARGMKDAALAARAALRTALLAGPVMHPWYLGWTIVWEPLAPSWPWLLLCALALLNYGVFAPPAEGGAFHLSVSWRWIEYGLPLLLAVSLRLFRRSPDV